MKLIEEAIYNNYKRAILKGQPYGSSKGKSSKFWEVGKGGGIMGWEEKERGEGKGEKFFLPQRP